VRRTSETDGDLDVGLDVLLGEQRETAGPSTNQRHHDRGGMVTVVGKVTNELKLAVCASTNEAQGCEAQENQRRGSRRLVSKLVLQLANRGWRSAVHNSIPNVPERLVFLGRKRSRVHSIQEHTPRLSIVQVQQHQRVTALLSYQITSCQVLAASDAEAARIALARSGTLMSISLLVLAGSINRALAKLATMNFQTSIVEAA